MINRKQVVYKTELYKLYKRKDTWIFLTVILVPILYSVGIASGSEIVSYSGNGNITAINFISAMFQMAQSMFIFNIILVAITSRTLGTEIEDKSLRIYLNKVGDRKKIYIEKVKALSVYAGVISVLLVVVGLFCYYFIMNDKTPIVNGALYDERISIEIIQIITIYLFWVITIFIIMMLAYNGDIYPYHMLHCQECKMGNIKHGRLKDIIDESDFEGNNILLDDIEECGICEYKNLCGGACRGRAYLFTGDMKKRDPYCLAAKRFYDNLFAQYTSI